MAEAAAATDAPPARGGSMSRQEQQTIKRAKDLARILKVPSETFAGKEAQAYEIMAFAATIPLLKEQPKRRQLANEVLLNASRAFPKEPGRMQSDFQGVMGGIVIQMQEYPYWFAMLTKSNNELIDEYKNLLWIIWGLEMVGYGGWSLGAATAGSGVVKGWDKAGAGAGYADKLRGAGKGVVDGVKGAATGGFAMKGFVAAWVVGQTTASLAKVRKSELELELNRRYKSGKMSYEEYQKAFGVNIDPPEKYALGD